MWALSELISPSVHFTSPLKIHTNPNTDENTNTHMSNYREIDRYGHTNTSIHTNTMWSVSGLIVPCAHVHRPQFAPDVVKVLPSA